MDLYEDVTQIYLTAVEGLFLLPQCQIKHSVEGKPWFACPDFVALDFRDRRIQVIEVTKRDARDTVELAEKLRLSHRSHVEHYVRTTTLANALEYPFQWRFFVRDEAAANALKQADAYKHYVATGGEVEVATLHAVFASISKIMP